MEKIMEKMEELVQAALIDLEEKMKKLKKREQSLRDYHPVDQEKRSHHRNVCSNERVIKEVAGKMGVMKGVLKSKNLNIIDIEPSVVVELQKQVVVQMVRRGDNLFLIRQSIAEEIAAYDNYIEWLEELNKQLQNVEEKNKQLEKAKGEITLF